VINQAADLQDAQDLTISRSSMSDGPSFAGRKLGVLGTDGADVTLLTELRDAAHKLGASVELIAPTVGSVTTSDGSTISADQKLEGGPSVLYDAVALDHDGSVDTFLQTCVALRFWQREAAFT
jgi:hypothetical protein